MLAAALLAALFAGALALGRSGAGAATAIGPVVQHDSASGATRSVAAPPATAALPRLRHPAPKATPAKQPAATAAPFTPAPTAVAPTTPVAPTSPAPSGGGGGGGGGVLISG
jgi:hypothetical protein